MFSSTRPIAIDANNRRRQQSFADYDYGLVVDQTPSFAVDSSDMMFDMDSNYDFNNNNINNTSSTLNTSWNPTSTHDLAYSLAPSSSSENYFSPTKDTFFDSNNYIGHQLNGAMDDDFNWALAVPSSAPISIPESKPMYPQQHPQQQHFVSFTDYHSPLLQDANSFSPGFSPSSFSPESDFAALHSPTSPPTFSFHHELPQPHYGTPTEALSALTISPQDTTLPYTTPSWAAQLWPQQQQQQHVFQQPSPPTSPHVDAYAQPRSFAPGDAMTRRPRAISQSLLFHPSSAPSVVSTVRPSAMARVYSTQSTSATDNNATVRRRQRDPSEEVVAGASPEPRAATPSVASEKSSENVTQKSMLRPPKLAPSAWQLYFTDWIQKHQQISTKKLNVAQAAKEAGAEYALLTTEDKEPYKRRSQQAKDAREREHNAYMRTLTPEDIKRENVFRTAQRKAGKSRRGNIKDPNAPKKPLSAYFMFLQRIRSDPELVQEVFGDETETTKQSVLAASKWRSMTDDERKPFLAQAEQEKLDYEEKRKIYEQGHSGYTGSFNFSILSSSSLDSAPIPRTKRAVKVEPVEDGAASS